MLTVPSPKTQVLRSALKTGLKLDLPNFLLFYLSLYGMVTQQ